MSHEISLKANMVEAARKMREAVGGQIANAIVAGATQFIEAFKGDFKALVKLIDGAEHRYQVAQALSTALYQALRITEAGPDVVAGRIRDAVMYRLYHDEYGTVKEMGQWRAAFTAKDGVAPTRNRKGKAAKSKDAEAVVAAIVASTSDWHTTLAKAVELAKAENVEMTDFLKEAAGHF